MSASSSSRSAPAPVGPARVRFHRVVVSEWIKLVSLRSTLWTLLVSVFILIGLGWLLGALTNSNWEELTPPERALFDPTALSLAGVNLAQLAVGVLGVLLITGEYSTGMIRASLAAVPRRLLVLAAKALVYASLTFALMSLAALAAFLGGQYFLADHGTELGAPHTWRSIAGVALYLMLIGVFALALGALLRNTGAAIGVLFALLLVLPILGLLLPRSLRENVLPYLPSSAGRAFYSSPAPLPDPSALSPSEGLLVLLLWVGAALTLAAFVLVRRDA